MKNEELVRTAFEIVWNRREVSRVREFYSESFQSHYPPGFDWGEGPDGLANYVTLIGKTTSDYHETIEDIFSAGDRVAVRMTNTGTHTGDALIAPVTGKSFEFIDITICRIEDGKIAEQWGAFDQLGLLMQLDQIQPPGKA